MGKIYRKGNVFFDTYYINTTERDAEAELYRRGYYTA